MNSQVLKYTARLPADLWAQVSAMAAEEGVSGNVLVVRALRTLVEPAAANESIREALQADFAALESRIVALVSPARLEIRTQLTANAMKGFDPAQAYRHRSPTGRLSESQPEMQTLGTTRPWAENKGTRPVPADWLVEIKIRGNGSDATDVAQTVHRAGDVDWSFDRGYFDVTEWRLPE